jgi:hypothetical protein
MTCPRVESSRGRDSLFEADNQPGRDLRVDSELEGLPLPYFIYLPSRNTLFKLSTNPLSPEKGCSIRWEA